jgi:DNA repair protein RadC
MAEQDVKELMKIKGLGQVKLCRIAAAFEIARRIVNQIMEEKQT